MNTRGTVGVPSSPPARVTGRPCEGKYDLMGKVLERSNMLRALHRVEQNKGAAGVDGIEIEFLQPYLKEHWPRLREKLLGGEPTSLCPYVALKSPRQRGACGC